jgi:hypothetical protein
MKKLFLLCFISNGAFAMQETQTTTKNEPTLEFLDRKSIDNTADKTAALKESTIEFKNYTKKLKKEHRSKNCKICCVTCGLAICCKKCCK